MYLTTNLLNLHLKFSLIMIFILFYDFVKAIIIINEQINTNVLDFLDSREFFCMILCSLLFFIFILFYFYMINHSDSQFPLLFPTNGGKERSSTGRCFHIRAIWKQDSTSRSEELTQSRHRGLRAEQFCSTSRQDIL